ncbi:MAG: CPBP family intramembrane metalloprotease [Lachnospiraceae bacterium]|nr:CPBP family intramembrane metalloprotease [Lachnospiraceae bacterium]
MRSAYNRSGIGIVALYGIVSVVSGTALGVIIGGAIGILLSNELMFGGIDSLNPMSFLQFMETEEYMDFTLLGSTIGSCLGMGVGILIIQKILPKEVYPIERRYLTAKELVVVILSAFGLWALGALIGNLPSFFRAYTITLESSNKAVMGFFCMYAVLGAPILEELVFRKLLLDRIHPFGETVAALTSALLFGLFHGNAAQFPLAFLFGIVSATVYLKTGRILYSILLHFMINLTGSVTEIFGLFEIDVTLGWNIVVLHLLIAGLLVYLLNRKKELFTLKKPRLLDANRQAFKNPGMMIAVIAGLVLLGGTELVLFLYALSIGNGVRALVRLIPAAFSVVTVILVIKYAGHDYEKLPEPETVPGEASELSSEINPQDPSGAV